jgi:5-formyltetrahydrofolate cyclo-ligase
MNKKQRLRKELLAARKAMAPEEKAWRDAAIGRHLLDWLEAHPVKSMGVYWPHAGEPDLTPVYPELAARGVTLALPVVVKRDAPLVFYAWRPGEELVKDAHGVMAPVGRDCPVEPESLLLPCVGFNEEGYRLGYGGGYYDRTLAAMPEAHAVGIAYAAGKVVFEKDAFDMVMELILSESQGFHAQPHGAGQLNPWNSGKRR